MMFVNVFTGFQGVLRLVYIGFF